MKSLKAYCCCTASGRSNDMPTELIIIKPVVSLSFTTPGDYPVRVINPSYWADLSHNEKDILPYFTKEMQLIYAHSEIHHQICIDPKISPQSIINLKALCDDKK